MAKNIAEQIVEMLEEAGVKRIYAVTGDSLNHLNIAVKKSSIEWIHVRHEEAGAYAAAAEAELVALYVNARKGVEIRNILEELGHRQPPTPIQTDNSTAESIINSRVQPKQTKAMDMRFHWLRDRAVNQKQFRFYWQPGSLQRADYWTKHHPPSHHCQMRSEILTPYQIVVDFRKKMKNRHVKNAI